MFGNKKNKKENLSEEIVKDLKDISSKEEVELVAKTKPVKTKKVEIQGTELSPEITHDVLEIAIAKFGKTNSGMTWEEISQEERWQHIKEANESSK